MLNLMELRIAGTVTGVEIRQASGGKTISTVMVRVVRVVKDKEYVDLVPVESWQDTAANLQNR